MRPDSPDTETGSSGLEEKPNIGTTLEVLKADDNNITPQQLYYGLSSLTPSEVTQLAEIWETIDPQKRISLLTDLAEASELNFEFDYRELGFFALNDLDANVREAAIELLWEDESIELMNRLIDIAQWDEAVRVRVAATIALGRFALLGEYGEIPEQAATQVQDVIVGILTNENEETDVRRRALEAIANSSHDTVNESIQEAYAGSEQKMKVSAIYAMGRSYDMVWRDVILREIDNDDPEIRYEAVRAAGELDLKEAVSRLGHIATNDERQIQEAAIWALGEIGGREALRILSALAQDAQNVHDESLLEAVEDALGNASLIGEFNLDEGL